MGTNTETGTDPSAATGTVFSKERGIGDNADTIITNTTKPAADSTANATVSDVVGSKDDAAQTTVATNRSLQAYSKGLLNRSANTTSEMASDNMGMAATIRQLIASIAAESRALHLKGSIQPANANAYFTVTLYKGPGASEVEIGRTYIYLPTAGPGTVEYSIDVELTLAAGTRISWNCNADAGTGGTGTAGLTVVEA